MQKCAAGPELTVEPGEQRRGLPSVIEEAPRQLKRPWRSRLRRRARRKPAPVKRCREPRLRQHWPDLPISEPAVSHNGAVWSLCVTVALGEMAPQGSGGSALCRLPRRWPPFLAERSCAPAHGHINTVSAPANRPVEDYGADHSASSRAVLQAELPLIVWQE